MFYGYALYYKDVEGFELPLFHRNTPGHDLVLVTPYREIAQRWFDSESALLKEELNPKAYTVTTGFWFWKRKMNYPPKHLPIHEFQFKAQVFNTLFIKKVKLV